MVPAPLLLTVIMNVIVWPVVTVEGAAVICDISRLPEAYIAKLFDVLEPLFMALASLLSVPRAVVVKLRVPAVSQ